MQVRIAGFQLTYHPELKLDKLATALLAKNGQRVKFGPHERILNVVDEDEFVLGSLLTDRGHRNFLAIDTQTSELSIGTLGANKNFGAFNFFILCKNKDAGLITTYKDAGGAAMVFGFIKMIADDALNTARVEAVAAATASNASKKQHAAIRAKYKPPSLKWVEVLGRTEYAAVLRKWKSISSIIIECTSANYSPDFVPSDDNTVDENVTLLKFKRGLSISRIVETLKSIRNGAEIEKAEALKVSGRDEWGFSRTVEIEERIPSLFGELNHDHIIADPSSFGPLPMSYVIDSLKGVIANSPTTFGPMTATKEIVPPDTILSETSPPVSANTARKVPVSTKL